MRSLRGALILAVLPLIAAGCGNQLAPPGGGSDYRPTVSQFQGDGSGGMPGCGAEPVIGGVPASPGGGSP